MEKPVRTWTFFYLEELYFRGYPASPTQRLVCLLPEWVRQSVRHISFNYSAENLLIPTIKATIETTWYWHRWLPIPTRTNFLGIKRKKAKHNKFGPIFLNKHDKSEKMHRTNWFGQYFLKIPWFLQPTHSKCCGCTHTSILSHSPHHIISEGFPC